MAILFNLKNNEYKEIMMNQNVIRRNQHYVVDEEQYVETLIQPNLNKCKLKKEKNEKLCLNISKKSLNNIQENTVDTKNLDLFPNETLDSNINIQGYFKDISGYSF